MVKEWGEEVRYLCDDRDANDRLELVILPGGNGDWYVGTVPEGEGFMGKLVRICTSGGAASAAPELPVHISRIYRHLLEVSGE